MHRAHKRTPQQTTALLKVPRAWFRKSGAASGKTPNEGPKRRENGNVQANVRANNSGQFEGTAHENVGFGGKKGQKIHPNFTPNITMEFHCYAFCAPDRKHSKSKFRGSFANTSV